MTRLALALLIVSVLTTMGKADILVTGAGFTIPDNDFNGVSSSVFVSANEVITDVNVTINGFSHTWIGDLNVDLEGPGGQVIDIMWRTGDAQGNPDGSDVSGSYRFIDSGGDWWAAAASAGAGDNIPNGDYQPTGPTGTVTSFATTFGGLTTVGNWTLTISDFSAGDLGSIQDWDLNIRSSAIPEPTTFGMLGLSGMGLALFRRRK